MSLALPSQHLDKQRYCRKSISLLAQLRDRIPQATMPNPLFQVQVSQQHRFSIKSFSINPRHWYGLLPLGVLCFLGSCLMGSKSIDVVIFPCPVVEHQQLHFQPQPTMDKSISALHYSINKCLHWTICRQHKSRELWMLQSASCPVESIVPRVLWLCYGRNRTMDWYKQSRGWKAFGQVIPFSMTSWLISWCSP